MCIVCSSTCIQKVILIILIFKAINNFLYSSPLNILFLQHFFYSTCKYRLPPMQYHRITILYSCTHLTPTPLKIKPSSRPAPHLATVTPMHHSNLRIHILTHCPGRNKYSLPRDKYFPEDSRIWCLHSKSLNMLSE